MKLDDFVKLKASFRKLRKQSGIESNDLETIRDCLNLTIYCLKEAYEITEVLSKYSLTDYYEVYPQNDKSGPLSEDELAALQELYWVAENIRGTITRVYGVKSEFPEPRDPSEGIPF